MNQYIMKGRFFGLLQEALKSANIDIELDVTEHESTIVPYIGEAHLNGKQGYYFRKANYGNFTDEEKEKIRQVFKTFRAYGIKLVLDRIFDSEMDDDRIYKSTIMFFTKVCGVDIVLTEDYINQALLWEYKQDEIDMMHEEDKVVTAGDILQNVEDSEMKHRIEGVNSFKFL